MLARALLCCCAATPDLRVERRVGRMYARREPRAFLERELDRIAPGDARRWAAQFRFVMDMRDGGRVDAYDPRQLYTEAGTFLRIYARRLFQVGRVSDAMNQARRQSARPGDFSKKAGAPKMPPEVRAMARQMGIPAEELAGADGMWAKLTAMSENDPKAYAELLGESAKHVAKAHGEELAEGQEPDDAKATELMNKLLAPTSMTPTAGYVVKAALK